jgi:molybdopterin molybdotransferase
MKQAVRVAEAQEIILHDVQPSGVEKIALLSALRRVMAEDVVASRPIPPHDNSAMDGYAVLHRDVAGATSERPAHLQVVEVLPAGKMPRQPLQPGTAVKIMTGAALPEGADTVVQIEHTNGGDTLVDIYQAPKAGSNLRRRGEDIGVGDCIVPHHTLLRPADLGVLASIGKAQVLVYQQPRVAILATGDEIADLGDVDLTDKIINSNSYTLAGQVTEAGGTPILLGVAQDTREEISQRLASGLQADVLITSGGVSAGDFAGYGAKAPGRAHVLTRDFAAARPGTGHRHDDRPSGLGYPPLDESGQLSDRYSGRDADCATR